jgi:hypothetical protein
MAGPATVTDLINNSLEELTPNELRVAASKLDNAYYQILAQVENVEARLSGAEYDATFRSLVVEIQCAAVGRFLKNPDGKYEESSDDYSFKRDAALATGEIYITDSELARLAPRSKANSGAWTIRPSGWRR